jgi:hypothetical protein
MLLRALAVAAAVFCFSGAATAQTAPDVYSVNGGQRTQMRAIMVSTSTQARPYAGVRQYAVMPGERAMTRLASDTSFLVAVPSNIQPQGVVVLASFEARRGNRLVLVGGGYMSWSTGIHPDRIIAVNMEPGGGSAPAGHTMYRVTPTAPLAAGEYAIVVATGQQQGYAGIPGTFFDFGVD